MKFRPRQVFKARNNFYTSATIRDIGILTIGKRRIEIARLDVRLSGGRRCVMYLSERELDKVAADNVGAPKVRRKKGATA